MDHIKEFGALVVTAVKDHVRRAFSSLDERIKAIEAREIPQAIKGDPGAVGPAGNDGKDGAPGSAGKDGADGKDGAPGKDGRDGEQGPAGKDGSNGLDGKDGAPGARGADGMNGKDADPVHSAALAAEQVKGILPDMIAKGVAEALPVAVQKAVDAMMPELVSKAAAAIPVPQDGSPGAPGKDGRDGLDGKGVDLIDVVAKVAEALPALVDAGVAKHIDSAVQKEFDARLDGMIERAVKAMPQPRDGKDGASVDHEFVKSTIQAMVDSLPKPRDGVDGINGKDGRDALDIEIRRSFDPFKRYQQGEHVAFRGGVIRANRHTDLMPEDGALEDHGWHVVQNGIAELAADLSEDGRKLGLAIKMTNGEVITKTCDIPITIYRGIWKETETYSRGDQVTWDGSSWTLMSDAKGKPGAEDSGFVLSTKRGRDGRDGIKGETGPRGAQGKDGRDLAGFSPGRP